MNRGFVLFNTVIILTALSLLAVHDMKRRLFTAATAANHIEHVRLRQAALSGIEIGRWLLITDKNDRDGPDDQWFSPQIFRVGATPVRVEVTDEQGKLNINHLLHPSGAVNESLWRMFRRIPGVPDIEPGEWRTFLARWHKIRRCPLPSPGMLRTLADTPRLRPEKLFTVFGNGRINVGTAPREILEALTGKRDSARRILDARKEMASASLFELKQRADLDENSFRRLLPAATMVSSFFTIRADAVTENAAVHVEAVIRRNSGSARIIRYREW